MTTFSTFGVTTHGVWIESGAAANRLVALITYPPGAEPDDVTHQVLRSPEFASDMAGFDTEDIVEVRTALLEPTAFSPIH